MSLSQNPGWRDPEAPSQVDLCSPPHKTPDNPIAPFFQTRVEKAATQELDNESAGAMNLNFQPADIEKSTSVVYKATWTMVFCYHGSKDTRSQSLIHSAGFSPRGSCQDGTREMPPDHCGSCLQFREDGGEGWMHSLSPASCGRLGRASVDNDNEPGLPRLQPLFYVFSFGEPHFPCSAMLAS